MKYTGEFYNEGADKTNKKPIEVKEEIMKKALSLLLASVMLLTCLAACGNSSTPPRWKVRSPSGIRLPKGPGWRPSRRPPTSLWPTTPA